VRYLISAEQTFARVFPRQFSTTRRPSRIRTILKRTSKRHARSFVPSSHISVWGARILWNTSKRTRAFEFLFSGGECSIRESDAANSRSKTHMQRLVPSSKWKWRVVSKTHTTCDRLVPCDPVRIARCDHVPKSGEPRRPLCACPAAIVVGASLSQSSS
jgi:hypothetical protein